MHSKLVSEALVVISLILNACALDSDIDCPKLPRRCSCTRDHEEKPCKIECRGVRYTEMENAFRNSVGYNFKSMEISKSKLKNATLFTNLLVEKLQLRFCKIRNFNLFENLGTMNILKSLVIEGLAMDTITFNSVSRDNELSQLEEFVLLDCPEGCDDESEKMIEYLPGSLTSIEIRWCTINFEGGYSFKNFPKLERLQLNNNHLTEFKRNYLPQPATHLRFLSLSKNSISSLPKDMFSDMPKLNTVELVAMELVTLQYDTFKPLLNKQMLIELAHNPLICNCQNSWILVEIATWKGQIPRCASPTVFKGKNMDELLPIDMCQTPGENFQETLEQYCEAKLKNTTFSR